MITSQGTKLSGNPTGPSRASRIQTSQLNKNTTNAGTYSCHHRKRNDQGARETNEKNKIKKGNTNIVAGSNPKTIQRWLSFFLSLEVFFSALKRCQFS
jgi:hypothetical protein